MVEKNFNTRIVHKHDPEANWLKATSFIPKQGEIIVYDIDSTYTYERFKIGDGTTVVSSLPFADDALRASLETQISEAISKIPAQVQSDWNQNDPENVGYIQNRTHWVDIEQDYITVVSQKDTSPTEDWLNFTVVTGLELGEDFDGSYLVNFDGVEYTCNSYWTADGYAALGDSRLSNSEDETNVENVPFCITISSGEMIGGMYFWDPFLMVYDTEQSWSNGHTIEIKKISEILTYHKLDPKFLPERVQSDWDQTDETAEDFIKNKPDENDALELLMEMNLVEPVVAEDGSVYTDENGAMYTII